jgi:hypothetical protein
LKVRQQRDANNPERPPDLFEYPPSVARTLGLKPIMGSASQLRSGNIVGDAFGIDPVFGAMLNPTGGLVGPGNCAFDADDCAVGYHGAVHDAAGYLFNYHRTGPGYDYLRKDQPRDPGDPLSGQREGIRWWRSQTGEGSDSVSGLSEGVIRGVVGGYDSFTETITVASDTLKGSIDTVKGIVW